MSLWKWLGFEGRAGDQEFDSLTEAENILTGLDARRRRYVACFAYILTRSARADHQITDGEASVMEGILARHTSIPDAQAKLVVDRKSTRLNSSHLVISYAVFCLKKNNTKQY